MSGAIEPGKQYAVNWNNHMSHIRNTFEKLFTNKDLTDVTLYCEGRKLDAHKVLLSACSTYFRDVFKEIPCNHPVIILKGVNYQTMEDILKFVYKGEVSVDSENFDNFIKTAQLLQISGLTENKDKVLSAAFQSNTKSTPHENLNSPNLPNKRLHSPDNISELPPLKLIKAYDNEDNDEKASSSVQTIKSEPKDISFEEEKFIDPLQPIDQEDLNSVDNIDHALLNLTSVEDFTEVEEKHDILQFESVYVDSDVGSLSTNTNSSAPPGARQSNFPENSLKCTVCDKVFSHPYSLHHHKAVHSGSTECPICHAVLSRKYNLKIHMKARHNC